MLGGRHSAHRRRTLISALLLGIPVLQAGGLLAHKLQDLWDPFLARGADRSVIALRHDVFLARPHAVHGQLVAHADVVERPGDVAAAFVCPLLVHPLRRGGARRAQAGHGQQHHERVRLGRCCSRGPPSLRGVFHRGPCAASRACWMHSPMCIEGSM